MRNLGGRMRSVRGVRLVRSIVQSGSQNRKSRCVLWLVTTM